MLYQAPFGIGNWAVAKSPQGLGVFKWSLHFYGYQRRADELHRAVDGAHVFSKTSVVAGDNWCWDRTLRAYRRLQLIGQSGFQQSQRHSDLAGEHAGHGGGGGGLTRCTLLAGSPVWESCIGQDQDLAATMFRVGTNTANLKGRLNFSIPGSTPTHIATLAGSNFGKTMATATNRPTNDANDTFIGFDQGLNAAGIGLSFGAPLSISEYIGKCGRRDQLEGKS